MDTRHTLQRLLANGPELSVTGGLGAGFLLVR